MHNLARLDRLDTRRICHLLNIMYHRSKEPKFLDIRDIPTRQLDKVKFKVINPVVKKAFKSPNYLGALLWDMLPKDTQSSGSLHVFKNKVAKHVKNGMFDKVRI